MKSQEKEKNFWSHRAKYSAFYSLAFACEQNTLRHYALIQSAVQHRRDVDNMHSTHQFHQYRKYIIVYLCVNEKKNGVNPDLAQYRSNFGRSMVQHIFRCRSLAEKYFPILPVNNIVHKCS